MKRKFLWGGCILGLLVSLTVAAAPVQQITTSALYTLYGTLQKQLATVESTLSTLSSTVSTLQTKVNGLAGGITVVDSNSAVVGDYLGINGLNGFNVLYKNGGNAYIIEVQNGAYVTDKTIYFSEANCTGSMYIDYYPQAQSSNPNIPQSVVYVLAGPPVTATLYGVGTETLSNIIYSSTATSAGCDVSNSGHTQSYAFPLSSLSINLQSLHPNPTVVFP